MAKVSAGLLMYKVNDKNYEFFLVHPGGPFFKKKDEGYWGIPKGEINDGENLLEAAKREFQEETGIALFGEKKFIDLGSVKMKSGKVIHAWAFEGDWSGLLVSNYFEMEWPLRSGFIKKFPEVDKAGFFTQEEAKVKMSEVQFELVERLVRNLK